MPAYIATADNSDLTPSWPNTSIFDKDMITGATGGGNFTVSVPASSTRSAAFITIAGVPNSDDWEDGGSPTVQLVLNMGDSDVDGRCRIVRLDSAGVILQSGSFTSPQVMSAGTKLFFPVAPTWTNGEEDCDNRYAIEFEFVENVGMSASLKIDVRVGNAVINTDVTEDAGTCGAVTNPQRQNISPGIGIYSIISLFTILVSKFSWILKLSGLGAKRKKRQLANLPSPCNCRQN